MTPLVLVTVFFESRPVATKVCLSLDSVLLFFLQNSKASGDRKIEYKAGTSGSNIRASPREDFDTIPYEVLLLSCFGPPSAYPPQGISPHPSDNPGLPSPQGREEVTRMRLEITAMEQRLAAAAVHPIGTGLPRDGRGQALSRGGGWRSGREIGPCAEIRIRCEF